VRDYYNATYLREVRAYVTVPLPGIYEIFSALLRCATSHESIQSIDDSSLRYLDIPV